MIGQELVRLEREEQVDLTRVQPGDVELALRRLGWGDCFLPSDSAMNVGRKTNVSSSRQRKRKQKEAKLSDDLIAEQERLLAASKEKALRKA